MKLELLRTFDAAAKRERPAITSHNQGNHGVRSEGWRYMPDAVLLQIFVPFNPDRKLAALQVAGKAGYRCGHFGKWHVGAVKKKSRVSPLAMGFHECLSRDNFSELNPSLSRNGGPPEVFKGERSEILIAETSRFIMAPLEPARRRTHAAAGRPAPRPG